MIKLPRIPDHLNAQWPYLPHQLRARDIEVAKAVLEAVANAIYNTPLAHPGHAAKTADQLEMVIRALEVSHD